MASDDLLLRIEATCRASLSSRVLRERLVALVRGRIGFDGHVFALTDPATKVGTSPHADVPMLPWPRLPELIRWRYLTLVNRPDRLSGGVASSLRTATAEPSESLMWEHVLRELGVVDTATVAFDDRYGAWGFLELWRTTAPFTRDELALLTAMSPVVTTALRSAQARTFADAGDDVRVSGPAVVVLGPDLRVRRQTDAAAAALLELLPPDEPMARSPPRRTTSAPCSSPTRRASGPASRGRGSTSAAPRGSRSRRPASARTSPSRSSRRRPPNGSTSWRAPTACPRASRTCWAC
jgi:hypothetical protein